MDVIEILLTPAKLVPAILGALFLALGVNLLLYQWRFEARAKRLPGKVVAIERYMPDSDGKAVRETGTCYRSWIEYNRDGKTECVYSSTASWVQHEPGETVTVLLHESKDGMRNQPSVKERITWLLPLGLSLAGLGAFDIALAQGASLFAIAVIAMLALAMGYLISSKILEIKTLAKQGHVDKFELHEDGRLFRTRSELLQDMNNRNKLRISCY